MFKIDDCFKQSGIFNDLVIKRFEENFSVQNGSRLWVTPGHVVFTKDEVKVHTCDARPYDFTSSPNEPTSDELFIATSPVLEIFFDTRTASTRMFIVLTNGDVHIFEYKNLLFEWARVGYFNVNIVSPNSNNNHKNIAQVLISLNQNTIYWSEKNSTEMGFDLNKREIPLTDVREITQSSVGVPQKLLKNCPKFELIEIRENICLVPHLPNSIRVYLIASTRSHISFFNINGKCLWRDNITDSSIDFLSLCRKTIGLWTQGGTLKTCTLLDQIKNYAYVMHNDQLLSINPFGEITNKVKINFSDELNKLLIMNNILCNFANNKLEVYNIKNGQLLQTLDLSTYDPFCNVWYHVSNIPIFGFYTNNAIYKLNYVSLNSFLASDEPCFSQTANILQQEHFHLFSLIRDLIHHKFASCDVPPLTNSPDVIQSEAWLLAIVQSCRENGFKCVDFPIKDEIMKKLLEDEKLFECKTKLNELLKPLVECYIKIEKYKNSGY